MRVFLKKYGHLPLACIVLLTANLAVFAACSFAGEFLYDRGGLSVYEIVFEKEYARIFFAMFLHGNVTHLFNNLLILFFLGALLEKEIGHVSLLIIYLLSGIGGNLASLLHKMMSGDWSVSIGASGAVFGLDGILLALVLLRGSKTASVTPGRVILMILLSLYSGYTGANIDNAAHLGGLAVGFLSAAVICMIRKENPEDQGQ